MEAFRQAVTDGADGVELDVRLSADGVPVVVHDAHLSDARLVRTTLRAELPTSVPTLDEVLGMGTWFLNIEIKHDRPAPGPRPALGPAPVVVERVRAHGAAGRVLISSFDIDTLDRVRVLGPELATGWLVRPGTGPSPLGEGPGLVERAHGHGCSAIHPDDALVDPALVARAHELGLAVNVWTVDDPLRLRELARIGVDAVITNDPARARAALRASRQG